MRIIVLLAVLISVPAQARAEGARARDWRAQEPRAQDQRAQDPRAQDPRVERPRESRYGPTTPRQAAAAVAVATARYDGPMLGWAGKRQMSAAVAAPEPEPEPFAPPPPPIAGWAGYQTPPAPSAYRPPPAAVSTAPPTSLYAAPRPVQPMPPPLPIAARAPAPDYAPAPMQPAPMQRAPTVDWSTYRSARVASAGRAAAPPPAPQPRAAEPMVRQAAAPLGPPPTPTPTPTPQPRQVAAVAPSASGPLGATGARYYSVGREYGMTPDAIPPAGPDSRVLITAQPSPETKDAVPQHGSADWLAAGVSGDEGDDDSSSKDRRAKARDQAL